MPRITLSAQEASSLAIIQRGSDSYHEVLGAVMLLGRDAQLAAGNTLNAEHQAQSTYAERLIDERDAARRTIAEFLKWFRTFDGPQVFDEISHPTFDAMKAEGALATPAPAGLDVPRTVPHCPHCDGSDIGFDAAATWCVATQAFEIANVFDDGHVCGGCDAELRGHSIEWRAAPAAATVPA